MRYKNIEKFYCPHCQKRLWNLGATQTYKVIFTTKLIRVQFYYQFEEFFCEEHGKMKLDIIKGFNKQSIPSALKIRLSHSKLESKQKLKLKQVK
jgi:hypothetical protein